MACAQPASGVDLVKGSCTKMDVRVVTRAEPWVEAFSTVAVFKLDDQMSNINHVNWVCPCSDLTCTVCTV